jgi:NAD(P)-dependent dehydrogenase (short-subunit alcohol dehydrogenase family)
MSLPVVMITGALTGIGRATTLAFAEQGARIVLCGLDPGAGKSFEKELRGKDVEADFFKCDVRVEEEIQGLVEHTVKRFGKLDIAINNAAVEGALGYVVDQTLENFDAVFSVNVRGLLLCMKHELRVMKQQGSGSIVNLSSVAGKLAMPAVSVYVASKHAVEGLTKAAAIEVAQEGIRVNAVAPGFIQTQMLDRWFYNDEEVKAKTVATVPMHRTGHPEEIAQTILWVASGKVPYICGASINVDGGRAAC